MNANKADDVTRGQTTLSESWDKRDPGSDSQTTLPDGADERTDTNVGPSSTHSSGEVENPDITNTEPDTHDSPEPETDSNSGGGLSSKPRTQSTDSIEAPKPISTYATTHTRTGGQDNSRATSDGARDSAHSRSQKSNTPVGVKVRKQKERSQDSSPDEVKISDSNTSQDQATPTGGHMVCETCPECESRVVKENGDQYCGDCGLLIADQEIDPGPDWRTFSGQGEKNKSRVGGPVKESIHDKGLSTQIGGQNRDAYGNQLNARKKRQMKRLRKWDTRFKVKDTQERNLKQAFGEINRLCSEMELPDYVKETACTIYRRAHEEELLPGRSIESIASASVYAAMRQSGIPKTLNSLISYCRVERSRITAAYTYIGRELGMEIEPPDVTEHLSRVASELDVMKATERKAKEIVQKSVEEKIHSGKVPSGMAAAAVYAATLITRCDRITQQEASDAGDVCELTIRTRHRELLDVCGFNSEDISPPSESQAETRSEPVDPDAFFSDTGETTSSTRTTGQVTQ